MVDSNKKSKLKRALLFIRFHITRDFNVNFHINME